MGGNPFAITSDELIKRQQGINGAGSTEGVQNTKETRDAKAKEELKGSNVLAQTNGGSMATTDGVFENYDGFTFSGARVQANSVDQEAAGATSDAKNAQSSAKDAELQSEQVTATAEEDKAALENLSRKTKSKTKVQLNKVNQQAKSIEAQKNANKQLGDEVNSIETEIEDLMAEDGQDYTAQTVSVNDAPVQQNNNQQGNNSQGNNEAGNPVGDSAGGVSAAAGFGGLTGGGQTFAMNSLPSGQQEYAPTSLTGMATQRSENMKNNPQSGNRAQTKSNNAQPKTNAQPKSNTAQPKAGSSLTAFGNNVTGKNADRINELMAESESKKGEIASNSSRISSQRTTMNSLLNSTLKLNQNTLSTANTKKETNTNGFGVAQAAQVTGATVTTTGGVITGIAQVKLASPTIATQAAGAALLPWGIGTTVAGGATTTAATFATGSATEGIQAAGNTATSGLQGLASVKQAQQQVKKV